MKNTFKKLAVLTACLFTGASALVLTACDLSNGGEVTNVEGLTAKSIAITTLPTKTTYKVGETFDKTGIKVTATFTNGKKGDVSDLVSFSNTEFKTVGKQQIGVAYQTAITSFEVTVEAKSDGGSQGGESGEGVQYTESAEFPAAALQSFLTTLGLEETIPAPTGATGSWFYASGTDQDVGMLFEVYTADAGTPGTNAMEDTYKVQLENAGWEIDDSNYDLAGYYADKGETEILFYTYEGEFVMDVYAANASGSVDYTESATFPAQALQSFLTSEGLTTSVPAATSSASWKYASQTDEEGNYFTIITEDAGTPGTNAIEDTYKATLLAASWEIDDSEYEAYGYYADKGDVEIQFYSDAGEFYMFVYAAEGSSQGGGDTPVTPSGDHDGSTVEKAFTAAEACTLARSQEDGIYSTSCYYVKDTVTSVDTASFDASYGTLTFNLGEFVAFRLKMGSEHTKFTSANDIKVGDEVVIYGQIVNYVSGNTKTPEMTYSYNNHIEGYVYSINSGSQGGGDTPVTPTPKDKADWTIMIYMCGSDLESDNGFASADISEILSVTGQPDDVNIIIETGGSTKWKNSKISATELGRWHVENKQLVKDASLTNASMAEEATFESFLRWGLEYYPADKTGVILWNHGGALSGCCFDERYSDKGSYYDYLTNSETKQAFNAVLGTDTKLEFVGYDCCLMQVQDVADFNSSYFNYMIAAEESEAGEGWAYDTWLDDLYAKKSTEVILSAACDGFIAEYDATYGAQGYDNDQTLSVLDLTKMSDYRMAFEAMAASLSSKITDKKFNTLLKTVKNYADTWMDASDYNYYINTLNYDEDMFIYEDGDYCLLGYYDYGSFDAKDFLTKLSNDTTLGLTSAQKTNVQNALTALNQVIIHNAAGDEAGESHGLAMICPADDYFATHSYLASETNFVTWRSAVTASGRSY